jgi:hypothetical protein
VRPEHRSAGRGLGAAPCSRPEDLPAPSRSQRSATNGCGSQKHRREGETALRISLLPREASALRPTDAARRNIGAKARPP